MWKITSLLFVVAALGLLTGCATPHLNEAAMSGNINMVKQLLAKGAKVNAVDSVDRTALHMAAINGQTETARILLDQGADVNAKAGPSQMFQRTLTPLHYAAMASTDYTDVVTLLLDRGANINAVSDEGRTPLHYAAMNGHLYTARLLLKRGANTSMADNQKKTPLLLAQEKGHLNVVRLLNEAEEKRYGKLIAEEGSPLRGSDEKRPSASIQADVDELPAIMAKPNKNAYAIVIGIEQYRQKLPKADFAVHDAETVAGYLSRVMGYPEENVVTLTNGHAALGDFVKYFEKWLPNNAEQGSTVFVYFSGHGAPNPKTGDAYLVPYDGDPSFIAETGYPLRRLYENLGKLPAKEIVVALDSCFSGAGGRSVLAKGARPLVMNLQNSNTLARNMTVMTAASGEQISSTYDEKGHGLFTYFLLKGIRNEDVLREDGSIRSDDLYNYVKPQVERIARKQYNNEQTPQLIGPGK